MNRFPKAQKQLGQHFLHAPHVIKTITDKLPIPCDVILEVGPGPAVLTPRLHAHQLPLHVFEKDQRFHELLLRLIPDKHIHMGDALEVDWQSFLSQRNYEHAWLVSNLPYNVSVPLTLAFMQCPRIHCMTLMYQKEVAEKFLPRGQKNSMSSLAALGGVFFHIERLLDVPPGAFHPPPEVTSQVLHFTHLPTPLIELHHWSSFESFLRRVFQNKRKQLRGLLKNHIPPGELVKTLQDFGLPEGVRAEALELQHLIALWRLDQKQSLV